MFDTPQNALRLRFAIRELHYSPLATPCPLSGTAIASSTFSCLDFLINALRQPNDNVSFTCSQRKYA